MDDEERTRIVRVLANISEENRAVIMDLALSFIKEGMPAYAKINILCVIADISKNKRTEMAERAERAHETLDAEIKLGLLNGESLDELYKRTKGLLRLGSGEEIHPEDEEKRRLVKSQIRVDSRWKRRRYLTLWRVSN